MEEGFSDSEIFWDEITRERMREVDGDGPFDFLFRGEYDPSSRTVRGIKLGDQRASVEADMVNVDLDSCYVRVYEVDISPTSESIPSRLSVSADGDLSEVFGDTENTWGYETSLLIFDREKEYEVSSEGVLEGSVHWPGMNDYEPDSAYEDIVRVLGRDVLAEF